MDMTLVKAAVFIVASGGFFLFSRRWLMHPKSHGFWRFFVFEGILLLLLINVGFWFRGPFKPVQLISWMLLVGSAFLPLHGLAMLVKRGKPKGSFENTRKLVTSGLYRYIRHPMYASLLYLAWGIFLKHITVPSVFLVSLITVLIVVMARVEEKEMLKKFGRPYASYMRATRMFIPYVI